MFHTLKLLIGLSLFAVVTSPCSAAFILEFGELGVVGDNSYAGTTGDTIVAQVYLTQTGGETALSSSSTALAIADFEITINGTGVTPVAPTVGPGFVNDGNTGVSGLTARIAEFESSGSGNVGVTTSADGVNDNSVLLGTISYQIGPTAGGVYNLSVAQHPTFGSFSLASALIPTPIIVSPASATLNVTAVPEPASLGLAGLAAVAAFGSARYRQRRNSPRS
jgi:MYXO-CTERM domain-containing protein